MFGLVELFQTQRQTREQQTANGRESHTQYPCSGRGIGNDLSVHHAVAVVTVHSSGLDCVHHLHSVSWHSVVLVVVFRSVLVRLVPVTPLVLVLVLVRLAHWNATGCADELSLLVVVGDALDDRWL